MGDAARYWDGAELPEGGQVFMGQGLHARPGKPGLAQAAFTLAAAMRPDLGRDDLWPVARELMLTGIDAMAGGSEPSNGTDIEEI